MPKCINDPKRSYKGNEPSPKGLGFCAHSEEEGLIKKGKDKNKWIVKKNKNGSKRWIKYKDEIKKEEIVGKENEKFKIIKKRHKISKFYFIHYNYEDPYLVYLDKKNVYIYAIDQNLKINNKYYSKKNSENRWMYTKLVGKFNAIKIFIGKSPKNKMTELSHGYGKYFNGNTILLEIKKLSYVYIGNKIIKFKTKFPIVKYISPVGNNDVPYPYAIDNKKQYYILTANIIIKDLPIEYKNDPYDYYYKTVINTENKKIKLTKTEIY